MAAPRPRGRARLGLRDGPARARDTVWERSSVFPMIPKLLTGSIVVALVFSATCGYGGTWASVSPCLVAAAPGQTPTA